MPVVIIMVHVSTRNTSSLKMIFKHVCNYAGLKRDLLEKELHGVGEARLHDSL